MGIRKRQEERREGEEQSYPGTGRPRDPQWPEESAQEKPGRKCDWRGPSVKEKKTEVEKTERS